MHAVDMMTRMAAFTSLIRKEARALGFIGLRFSDSLRTFRKRVKAIFLTANGGAIHRSTFCTRNKFLKNIGRCIWVTLTLVLVVNSKRKDRLIFSKGKNPSCDPFF